MTTTNTAALPNADLIDDLRRAAKALIETAVEATMADQSEVVLDHEGARAIADLMFDAGWKLKLAQPAPCDREPKQLRNCIQLDGWANFRDGDSFMVPDKDCDVLIISATEEPQRSDATVRTYVAAEAEREDVLRILRKQLAWYERNDFPHGLFDDVKPPF